MPVPPRIAMLLSEDLSEEVVGDDAFGAVIWGFACECPDR